MTTIKTKRLLITGASGGMGKICARLAARQGYDLILADLVADGMRETVRELGGMGVGVSVHAFDLTDRRSVNKLIEVTNRQGNLDAVIHTVGVSPNMTDWQRIIDIDLLATAKLLEAVKSAMKPGAAAVCISSSSGYMCPADPEIESLLADPLSDDVFERLQRLPDNPLQNTGYAYSYAKKALRHFVAERAFAWGREGKRLVSISPGLINTEAGQMEYAASKTFEKMLAQLPLQRLGEPEDIANTALFLISEQAAYITGCDLLVDGGLIAAMNQARRAASEGNV